MTRPGGRAGLDWLLWALLRGVLVAIILGAIPWPEQVNDLAIYGAWADGALAAGTTPDDPMWQYPPLAAPVFLMGARLPGDRLGFVLLFLLFDAAIMAMLQAQARRTGLGGGRRLWALVPLVTGPLLLARFDVVPTAFAVGAVLVLGSRPALAGALAAVGAWLKVWPALVVAGARRGQLPRVVGAAMVTSLVVAGVLAMTMTDPFRFLSGQVARGLQIESVAAWPFLVGRLVGADVAVAYQYGAHEVVAAGVAAAATACLAASVALLGLIAVLRLLGRLEAALAADVALAAVLSSVVTSRVFSGQYFIWLLALGAICLAEPATAARRAVHLLVAAGLATQLVYPWLYTALLEGAWYAVLAQSLRVGLSVAAAVLLVRMLLRAARQMPAPSPHGSSGS